MKYLLIFILCLGFSLNTVYPQEKVKFKNIKVVDIDGRVYYFHKDKKFNGVIEKEDSNEKGSYLMEFEVKDGRMNGKAVTVYSDGYVQKEYFVDNLLEGQIELYYPNGNIQSRTTVKNNNMTGPFEDYYENGNLKQKGNLIMNEFDGVILRYYNNGQLWTKTNYSMGKVVGLNEEYDLNGELIPKAKIGIGTMVDPRDGQTYSTFTFQDHDGILRTWMTQNLNYKTASSISYDSNKKLRKKFPDIEKVGMAYTWADAMDACPDGWHVPSDYDWQTLIKYLGGRTAALKALKSTKYWHKDSNGTNSIGFNALPVGGFWANGKHAGFMGKGVSYWASQSTGAHTALGYNLRYDEDFIYPFPAFYKVQPAPCRCEKDYPSN